MNKSIALLIIVSSTLTTLVFSQWQPQATDELKTAVDMSIDDNTTAKIIQKLAQDINLILPENIIHFLLSRIPRDFFSIKDAVLALNQESYLQKKKVTLSLVKKALEIF